MRRRNGMGPAQLIGALREWRKGLSGEDAIDADALIAMVDADPDIAGAFAEAVNAKLDARAARKAAAPAARAELTDREGWTMLAELVRPDVLPDLTEAERDALRAAFLDEARKAA